MSTRRVVTREGTSLQLVDDPGAAKRALRSRLRAERRARPGKHRRLDAEALAVTVLELPELSSAGCVTVYASTSTEPGTGPLRAALRASGIRVLLPVVQPEGVLDWAEDDGGPLRRTPGVGGDEPTGRRLGPRAIGMADAVLAPALAVDTLGQRLGQGAGFFDRALRMVGPGAPVFAIVHEFEVFDAAVEPLPVELHDVRVDAVVTPRGCLRLHLAPRW